MPPMLQQGLRVAAQPEFSVQCIHATALSSVAKRQQPFGYQKPRVSPQSRSRSLAVVCRRRDWNSKSSSRSRNSGKAFRFTFNRMDVTVAEDQMWRLMVPFAALFGVAMFVGPIVVGLMISAIAVGAAFSAGALAFTTLLLPLIILTGLGGLLSFGAMATLGAAFFIPKMVFSALPLAFVGGGLALGWGGVNWLLRQTSTAANGQPQQTSKPAAAFHAPDREEAGDSPDDVRRMASELREFDELLARSEEQRRLQQWR